MSRERLPNRRHHESFAFEHAGIRYTAGIGRFNDGQLAEIFLNGAKCGTDADTAAKDAAIVASLDPARGDPQSRRNRKRPSRRGPRPSGRGIARHRSTMSPGNRWRCTVSRDSGGTAPRPTGERLRNGRREPTWAFDALKTHVANRHEIASHALPGKENIGELV